MLNHGGSGDAPSWRDCMSWPGAESMRALAEVISSVAWTALRPDPKLAAPSKVDDDFSNYIAAATAEDRSLALLYLPANPSAVLDLASFARPMQSVWIHPATGERTNGSRLPAAASVTVRCPGPGDWLLLLRP